MPPPWKEWGIFAAIGMKRKQLLPMLLCLLLAACSGDPTTGSSPDRQSDAAKLSGTEDQMISYQVRLDTWQDTVKAEDGTVVAECRYEIPVLAVIRKDGTVVDTENAAAVEMQALKTAHTFNETFQTWAEATDFQALGEAALQDYQWRQEEAEDIAYSQTLETTFYQTDRLISVAGLFDYYGGGPHPNLVFWGWNFDLERGAFFSAGQLFDDVDAVTAELIRQAREKAEAYDTPVEEYFWGDYEEVLANWSESAVAVTFDAEEMTVSYSPYDLAAYAAGAQIFSIPRTFLEPYLNEYGQRLLAGT